MKPCIDVHMLTLNEPAEWREACVASLAGAPIHLHKLPGIPGRSGLARAAGFAQGELPLVSFVDPDDTYEASAFSWLADALDACPNAVLAYTNESLIDADGQRIGVRRLSYSQWQHARTASQVHGLIVMRRSAVEQELTVIAKVDVFPEWALTLRLARRGAIIHLPVIGRYWRQHAKQTHRMARNAARKQIYQIMRGETDGID